MKMRILLMVALTLVMAGSLSIAPAAAGDAVVPFKATLETYPGPGVVVDNCMVFPIPGEGQATHLGETTWYADSWACFDGTQHGTMEFNAANGDQLFGHFEGTWSGMPPGPVAFDGTFWITAGTGRFKGVTATGDYGGWAEGNEGMAYFNGMLTK